MGLSRHQLDRIGGQARHNEGIAHDIDENCVTRGSGRRPAKKSGVAALEAKPSRIDGDIGACLVDHADHAHGHADLADLQAIGQRVPADHFADRVGKRSDITQCLGDIGDARGGQGQAIDDRGRGSVALGPLDVNGIGRDDLWSASHECIGQCS